MNTPTFEKRYKEKNEAKARTKAMNSERVKPSIMSSDRKPKKK